MTPEEIEAVIITALDKHSAKTCGRCCTTCDLAPHEHRDHHEALKSAFSARSQVLATILKVAASGAALWFGMAVWEYFKFKAGSQ